MTGKLCNCQPANVYGPGDNFDPQNAMVIASLMCRIFSRQDPLIVWGRRRRVRDFVFTAMAGRRHDTGFVSWNADARLRDLGSGYGITIKELVETTLLVFNIL